MPAIVALVPARDEAERVGATVRSVLGIADVVRVIVVDDGSTDGTADVAKAAGAEVVVGRIPSGKGGAMNAGLDAALSGAEIVLLLDADLGETAAAATELLGPVLAGEADMTIGDLPRPPGSGGFGLVKSLARRAIRSLGGMDAAAPLSGQRAVRAELLRRITPFAPGFGVEVALTVRAARAGARIVEVPVHMSHAATGKTPAGFYHRARQLMDVARTAWVLAREPGPTMPPR